MLKITKKIYSLQSLNFLKETRLNIGVLGGSFDPAHAGHFMISMQALKLYKFDYIIWLIANQNPLKPKYKNTILERANFAAKNFRHSKILISTAEYDLNTCYLYDSLKNLNLRFFNNNFTWLMGIDNLKYFHKWYKHEDIISLNKVIIFDRPGPERFINNSRFSLKFKPILAKTQTSNIIIDKGKMQDISSSAIRKFKFE